MITGKIFQGEFAFLPLPAARPPIFRATVSRRFASRTESPARARISRRNTPMSSGVTCLKKPRSPREKILSRGTLIDISIVGVIIALGTLFLFWLNLTSGASNAAVKAVTVSFTAMVMFEMVRIQSVRMKYKIGTFSNMKLILAMAVSILLQLLVIYAPLLHPTLAPLAEVFTTTPLNLLDWAWIIGVSSTVMIVMFLKEKLFGSEI